MIRLVTLSRLSLLREPCEDDPSLSAAVDSLSTAAAAFDCHLLQSPGAARPLDALGTPDQQARLQEALAGRQTVVQLVTTSEQTHCSLPAWISPVIRQVAEPDEVSQLASGASLSDVEFSWMHFEVTEDERFSDWVTAVLEMAATCILQVPDELLIVTSVAGESSDSGRFESLLWEGSIRVPLWLAGSGTEVCREHRPTGSHDVLETILSELTGQSAEGDTETPRDLRTQLVGHQESSDRRIRIVMPEAEAIRAPDFLIVRALAAESAERVALYEKPHDLWNVHDVSREYPEMADQLLAQLQN